MSNTFQLGFDPNTGVPSIACNRCDHVETCIAGCTSMHEGWQCPNCDVDKKANVITGRFTPDQQRNGFLEDVLNNENIEDIVVLAKFKDGSTDAFGSMTVKDLLTCMKLAEHLFINPCLRKLLDGDS